MPKKADMKIGPTEITSVDTDYPDRPAHRGHTVKIEGWNDEYVMLVINSDDRTNEAMITPAQLERLTKAAKEEAPRW